MKFARKMVVFIVIGLLLVAFLPPAWAESKKVELKLWSAWPEMNDPSKPGLQLLREMINEKGKAANISVKYIGGPEIFGPMQGCESVLKGVVDMAYTAAAYSTGIVPEVDAMKLLSTTGAEDRANGVFDLMNKWHNENGLEYMARASTGQQFQGYLNKDIREPNLKGLTMRVSPVYLPLLEPLGAKAINTVGGEVYTALERGIADGFWWGGREIRTWGWHEVVKYIWGPPIWTVDVYVYMSKKTWDRLDTDQKKTLTDIMKAYEIRTHDSQVSLQAEITKDLLSKGMKEIRFSPDKEKWYLEMAYTAGWKEALRKSGRASQLKEIVDKGKK